MKDIGPIEVDVGWKAVYQHCAMHRHLALTISEVNGVIAGRFEHEAVLRIEIAWNTTLSNQHEQIYHCRAAVRSRVCLPHALLA